MLRDSKEKVSQKMRLISEDSNILNWSPPFEGWVFLSGRSGQVRRFMYHRPFSRG